jgi:hypothetical protein
MTPEQIEAQKRRLQWMMSGESVPPPSNSKLTLVEEIALCDLALKGLQAEAMRDAIKKALEKMKNSMGHKEHDCKRISSAIVDLQQALNERKET